ncbi:MAG: hypothetical protein WBA18_08370 [Terracidiphilus sp.]
MASSASTPGAASTSAKPAEAAPQPKRSFWQIFTGYFYWTYSRGSFHYDVMVTLILLFIFVTPHLWNFGAKPSYVAASTHPLQVVPNGRGVIITVQASDVGAARGASYSDVKKALRKAIEPVTGDDVIVEHWETATDAQGNLTWKVWAHR